MHNSPYKHKKVCLLKKQRKYEFKDSFTFLESYFFISCKIIISFNITQNILINYRSRGCTKFLNNFYYISIKNNI